MMDSKFSAAIGLGVTLIVIACSSTTTAPTPSPAPTACPGKKTCPAGVGVCGSQDDGCGGTMDCGDCTGGQKCMEAADVVNRCTVCRTKAVACPNASQGIAFLCGINDDFCGGQIDCGPCTIGPCDSKTTYGTSCGCMAVPAYDPQCPTGFKGASCINAAGVGVVPKGCRSGTNSAACCPG